MGTNYYGKKTTTKENLIAIAQLVLNGDLEQATFAIRDCNEEIHIGKSSVGWKFIFNKNRTIWTSFEEFKNWVNQYTITSEYGDEMSHEDFFRMVENRQSLKSSVGEYCFMLEGYDFSTSDEFC